MLTTPVTANANLYQSHSQSIRELHQAFVDHVYPASRPDAHGDPSTFDHLQELRSSRESMHKIYALGEDLWAEWIQDESMLAKSVDEKVSVMEKCSKAVTEEFGSVKLWLVFGDWLHHTHRLYHEACEKDTADLLTEEKLVGRDIFSWQVVLETWQHGAEDTMLRINDSHLVWNRYIELLNQHLSQTGSKDTMAQIKSLFDVRLQTPHADWDGTFQLYSTFISTYCNDDYEEIMVDTNRKARDARSKWEARQTMEFELGRSQDAGDRLAEYTAFGDYLQWERTPEKRKRLSFDLTNALYQRFALRFPTDPPLWEDHVLYLLEQGHANQIALPALPTLERATRHCPWSGALWAHYLLASEREGQSFSETEDVKHKATSTGLLDASGMEEVIKVHTAWCVYLRRRAFQPESTDEDLDVAEMGIRSSIENLHELATQKFGEHGNPDPMFRLEGIYIRFLTQNGNWDTAREIFRRLVSKQGYSWQFWMRFYTWEMSCWAEITHHDEADDDVASKKSSAPHFATALLRQAVQREDLDWPEKIMDAYLTHCEDYADVEELQMAMVEVHKMQKVVAKKREANAYQVAAQAQTEAPVVSGRPGEAVADAAAADSAHTGKRKRDGGDEVRVESGKKNKMEEADGRMSEGAATTEKQLKRDRENATILVQELPDQLTETRLRQFFRDCGTINSMKLVRQNGTSAVIEFDEKEAALFAQSRDGKDLDGETIQVQLGSGSTVFVANFAPTADEQDMRSLLERFGEIIDVRFPSLKYNTHRRFCYVQFKLNAQAQAATELDGHEVDDDLKLVVKISNPAGKQDRSGAMEEGREVYCRNVHWNASEDDIKSLFERYGEVESVRIPRKTGGQSKGFCFVVFSSEDAAKAATALNGHSFLSRQLHVELSSRGGAKRQATTIISHVDGLRSPAAAPTSAAGSPSSATSSTLDPTSRCPPSDYRARTIALLHVPDTVNTSRIRGLAERYGPLVKIVLRPDHQGAIVEYGDAGDAGKASLGLDGYEITADRRIGVGTVPELLREKAEKKTTTTNRFQIGLKAKSAGGPDPNSAGRADSPPSRTALPHHPSGPIKRPVQRSGRRGGLGRKGGGAAAGSGFAATASAAVRGVDQPPSGGGGGGKSNSDFRDLLAKSAVEKKGEGEEVEVEQT